MKKINIIYLLAVLFIFIVSLNSFAATLEVGTGKTYTTIQSAINAASSGDTISVYPKTYTENISLISPASKTNITIQSVSGASTTIIDGNSSGTVVTMNSGCTIDGFTIQNGTGTTFWGIYKVGGGIFCDSITNVTIQNCIITNNRANGNGLTGAYGGGICAFDTTNSTLSNCTISSNRIIRVGGGTTGGGVLLGSATATNTWTVTDCIFDQNIAPTGRGGALYANAIAGATSNSVTFTRCTFSNNSAEVDGGAAFIQDRYVTFTNCLFYGNETTDGSAVYGGGLVLDTYGLDCTYEVTNCTFDNNDPGAIGMVSTTGLSNTTTIKNTILYENTDYGIYENSDPGSTVTTIPISNCFYNNTTGLFYDKNGTSLILEQINALPGASGNISADPSFVSSSDYQLQLGSPCINTADATGAPTTDFESVPRPQRGGYDIGAYEYTTDTWYLAEGSTVDFDTWICIQNPGTISANYQVTFMDNDSNTAIITDSLEANSRTSIRINDTASMDNKYDVSTKVVSTNNMSLIVERAMYWPKGIDVAKTGGTCSIGTTATGTTWYLAEGSTNGFDTWICVQNPSTISTVVTITYMDLNGNTEIVTQNLSANSRMSTLINDTASMNNKDAVSTKVESSDSVGIIVERAMYWPTGTDIAKTGGTCSIGTTTTGTSWYLAEGSTIDYDTWICVQNPSATATTITLTFMDNSGNTDIVTQSLAANSRMSYRINDSTDPNIANTSYVSTKVESSDSVGVIAERVMYWPEGIGVAKTGGTCSIGTPAASTNWYLAEGSTIGYDTWICVQNPSAAATDVTLTYMNGDGETATVTQNLAANSRMSKRINDTTDMDNTSNVSTQVTSSDSVGIIAERVMYWPEGVGVSKTGGHCSVGSRN